MKKIAITIIMIMMFASTACALPTIQKNTLCWDPPTTNTDGTPLTNLKSFKVYWSNKTGTYVDLASKDVGNVSCTSIATTVGGLLNGTYYFVVTAVNTSSTESGYSNEVSAPFFIPMNVPANLILK